MCRCVESGVLTIPASTANVEEGLVWVLVVEHDTLLGLV